MSTALHGLAILGAGIFVKEAYIPALASLRFDDFVLRAIYSRSKESAQAVADQAATVLAASPAVYYDSSDSEHNLHALLLRRDISTVIIALPIVQQPDFIIKSLAAGKHVLSEKPVAADVKRGLELLKIYRTQYQPKGLIWRVAENFEAETIFREASVAIRSGKIGEIRFFKSATVNYIDPTSKWYNTPWRTVPDYQGGFLLDGGVHTIAALRVMLPERITGLSAFASLNKDYLKPHDTIHAIARAGPQFHGIIEMTWASPVKEAPPASKFVITGSRGWLSIDGVVTGGGPVNRLTIVSTVKEDGKEREIKESREFAGDGVEKELFSLFSAVSRGQTGEGELGNPAAALRDVAFIQAALSSGGSEVDLTDLVADDI